MGAQRVRLTISVAEASVLLGIGERRVLQMLDDGSPLEGTAAAGRGRPRRVYVDSIDAARADRERGQGRPGGPAAIMERLERMSARIDELASAVASLQDKSSSSADLSGSPQMNELREENERLRFELTKSDAAADALRDSIAEQDAADGLRRRAAEHDALSRQALARAEKARDDSRPPR